MLKKLHLTHFVGVSSCDVTTWHFAFLCTPHQITPLHPPFEICSRKINLCCLLDLLGGNWQQANSCVQPSVWGRSAGSFAEQQLVIESTWIEVKPRFRDPDEKTCPFPLNRAVPSEEVTDTKNMWTFLRTNFCDPWMEVPLNRGFPNLNESFHCIWMSTDSLYMRNIKLSQDFRLQKESSRLRWLLLEPELLWS